MALNHTHQAYPNFVLENQIEDQYNSHLDLMRFCTVDNSLVGVAGDKKKIRRYRATNATEKLAMGEGNTQNIEVTYGEKEYEILLAQNRFPYYDEELMKDPLVVDTGVRHMTTDMFNSTQADIYGEFKKATIVIPMSGTDYFSAFVDAVSMFPGEAQEGLEVFSFVSPSDKAAIRKALKDDLKYVEAFVRAGYVGTVGGVNLYTKADAVAGEIYGGTKSAVTFFNKKGVEVEQERDANVRLNKIYSRKYYLAALTDERYAFKIVKGTATATDDTTPQDGVTYYAQVGNGYVAVTPVTGDNPATKGWYEIA